MRPAGVPESEKEREKSETGDGRLAADGSVRWAL
jgi:hypothetical protein